MLNPGTSLSTIEWVLKDVDLVLLMSVNPGFGGQSFIESQVQKTKELKKMCNDQVRSQLTRCVLLLVRTAGPPGFGFIPEFCYYLCVPFCVLAPCCSNFTC